MQDTSVVKAVPAKEPFTPTIPPAGKKDIGICQNLGAASSNPVQTRQDTMDVDCVLGIIEKRESERKTHFVCLSSSSIGYYWLYIIL